MIKIVSFNVNSIRVRLDHILQFLDEHSPDIIGLQETKVQDHEFPVEPFADAGYEVQFAGQKTHYGVALLSKETPEEVKIGFDTDTPKSQKRLIRAKFNLADGKKLNVINGYFPQGENREHPVKFPAKMKFYDDLMEELNRFSPEDYVLVMGDLNISPTDKDIGIGEKNAKRWLQTGKCSFLPEERERIQQMKDWGLIDSFRQMNPDVDNLYSWFDYRSKGFEDDPKRGLRIDQIWVTKPLMDLCRDTGIDYVLRGQEKPSDHCPIWSDFDLTT